MIPGFSVKFVIDRTVPSYKIQITDTTDYTGVLTAYGFYRIEYPDGLYTENSDVLDPDFEIGQNFSEFTLRLINFQPMAGQFRIIQKTFTDVDDIETTKTLTFSFVEPSLSIVSSGNLLTPTVLFTDNTNYNLGFYTEVATREIRCNFPAHLPIASTELITTGTTLDMVSTGNYYEGVYYPRLTLSVVFTASDHVIEWSKSLIFSFDIRKLIGYDELLDYLNIAKERFDAAVGTTKESVERENYQTVSALVEHIQLKSLRGEVGVAELMMDVQDLIYKITCHYPDTYIYSTLPLDPFDGSSPAFDRYVTAVSVTGTATKTITLTRNDGILLSASWNDIDTSLVTSVNGKTGDVTLFTDDIQEDGSPINLWFTQARSRSSISLTTIGVSGLATYSSLTGVFNIPDYTYTHPSYTVRNITASGAIVLSTFSSDSLGHVTGITTRTLTLADLGYTGATNADNYGSWLLSASGTAGTSSITSGATVVLSAGTGMTVVRSASTITFATTITQYTDALARASVSLTTVGSSGASTYSSVSGVFNIPNYTLSGLGGTPSTRTLTINGVSFDLSANRTWNVGTVTQINTGSGLTGGPITGSGTISHADTSSLTGVYGGSGISSVTLDEFGHITTITTASYVPTSRSITINGQTFDLSQDRTYTVNIGVSSISATSPIAVSASTGAVVVSHDNSGVTPGTYNSFTVDQKGHITSASNQLTGHVVQDNGVSMTQRTNLNFIRMIVQDNIPGNATNVTRPPSVTISTTAPTANLLEGDEWINDNTWKKYAWYDGFWAEVGKTNCSLNFTNINYSPYSLLQEGATDGQALVWSTINNRYEPKTITAGTVGLNQVAFGIGSNQITGNANLTWNGTSFRVGSGTGNVSMTAGVITLNTGEDGTGSSKMIDFKNTSGGGIDIEKRGGVRIIAKGDSVTGIYILQGHRSSGEVMRVDGDGSYDTEGYIISKRARLYDSTEEIIVSDGTTTINPGLTPAKNYTLQSNRTIQFSTGYSSLFSWTATVRLKQDSVGGRILTWSVSGQQIVWQGGIAPLIAPGPNEVTFISLYWDGVNLYGFKTCGFS